MQNNNKKKNEELTMDQKIKIMEMSIKVAESIVADNFKECYISMVNLITEESK